MCMALVVPSLCGPVILTDRRVSTFSGSLVGALRETIEDRLVCHADVGGRMVRVGPSWVIGGGGSAPHAAAVLRAAIEAGSTKPPAKEWTRETMGRWTMEVAGIIRSIAAELSTADEAEVADSTFFVTLDSPDLRGNVFGFKWDGSPIGGWKTVYHAPPNLGEYTKSRLTMNLEKDIATISDWPSIVRRVAGECVLVSRLCKTVSPTCEVACGNRFYSGDAKKLSRMTDEEIIAAFGDAPGNAEALERVNALCPASPAHAQTIGGGSAPSRTYYGTTTELSFSGTDIGGLCGADTGATPGTGAFMMLTFASAYASAPFATLTAGNTTTASALPYVWSSTTTDITFAFAVAPGASLSIVLHYQIIG